MSAKVLGRITTAADRPRGPDVQHVVTVPEEWLVAGVTLEVELPRNLACAVCGGGGCDACERSGAVSLRGRKEPVETVELTLPATLEWDEAPDSGPRVLTMRIPDRGGPSLEDAELPRGNLLLTLRAGGDPPSGVRRLAQPSEPPPPPAEIVASSRPAAPPVAPASSRWPWLLVALVAAAIAAWLLR